MSRLLYRLSYTALTCLCRGARNRTPRPAHRAPIRNRTVDLLLTMETLYRLSYWGGSRTWEFIWSREKTTRPRSSAEIGYPVTTAVSALSRRGCPWFARSWPAATLPGAPRTAAGRSGSPARRHSPWRPAGHGPRPPRRPRRRP